MNKIKESSFRIESKRELSKLLLDSFRESHDVVEFEGNWGHIVYVDTEPKQVIIASVYISRNNRELNFCEILKDIEPFDLQKLLLLVTTYPSYPDTVWHKDLTLKKVNTKIDMLLQETNGWIVYHHQLEKLIQMTTNCNFAEARTIRKRSNAKHQDAFDKILNTKVDGIDLISIIEERLKLRLTFSPNYEAAYRLFNHLNYK
ncbi:MAG: hypothetical protein PHW82_05610 [Bacteroidales bacterium]|nr:hypothetical protein [Bacteroidales bacterium]